MEPRQRGSAWLDWLLVLAGVGIAAVAGVMLSRAWAAHQGLTLCTAGLTLVCGVLLTVSGMRNHTTAFSLSELTPGAITPAMTSSDPTALPRLGEILVYKYQLITERDLKKALTRQAGTGRRLGEVLVEMGRISWLELARALEDQLSYGDPWKAK